MSALPSFVGPTPPYPSLTAVRGFAPPDDLRIESLGRPPMGFGPRSFKPTAKDRINATARQYIAPAPSVRLESLPANETEWREGFIRRKATYMNGTPFDIKVGRGDTVMAPFTMQRGLPPGQTLYRTPTPCLNAPRPFGSTASLLMHTGALSRSATAPRLDPIGSAMPPMGVTPFSPPRYNL